MTPQAGPVNPEEAKSPMANLTLPALRAAIENRDAATLAGFYADNAVLQVIDQEHPPSRPRELKGRDAIAAYFDDICGRPMTHRVENGIAEGDRLAFTQACTYQDGKKVFSSVMADVAGGKIAREVAVQAWDP